MKNKIKFIILLIIILIVIIKLDIFNKKEKVTLSLIPITSNVQEEQIPEIKKAEDKKEEIKKEEINKPVVFDCPSPKKEYDDMSLLNIGQNTILTDTSYIPKDLKELSLTSSTRKGLCLVKKVKEAFELMVKEATKENIKIKVSSAFRSYATQKILYENDLKTKKLEVSDSVAKAGYSEHQLGTTIDITGSSIDYTSASDKFSGTIEDEWLKKNSYLYGFIQSYPSGKAEITGYKYEPWHYRYVGIDKAKEIKDSNLTIIEFLK